MLVLKISPGEFVTMTNTKTGDVIVVSDQPQDRTGFQCSDDWEIVRSDAGKRKPRERDDDHKYSN